MAQIVKNVAQEGLNAGSAPSVNLNNTLGQAVEGFGNAIGNLGAQFQKRAEEKENFNAENARRKADHHVNAYRCQHCTWWHVGTPQFPRSGGRPRIDEAMLDELPRRLR